MKLVTVLIPRLSRYLGYILVGLALYLASIPVTLVGLYLLKNSFDIDTLHSGGWHHFNACLKKELSLTEDDYQKRAYGALAPAVPVLTGLGLLPLSSTQPSASTPAL